MTTRLAPLPPAARDVGALLFVRYAYPPNELGYCGPPDTRELFDYATTGTVDGGLRARAQEFDGAWPYLQLIASANGIDDPLDPRIVRGYWLGGPAAQAVRLPELAGHVEHRFRRRSGTASWRGLASAFAPGAVPDHAFHVLAVYPWVGLMREGLTEPARTVIESCCIRPARVVAVGEEDATVDVRSFAWSGSGLRLGALDRRTVRWRSNGGGLVDALRPGDAVALHWDWVCERIDAERQRELTRSLARRLASTGR